MNQVLVEAAYDDPVGAGPAPASAVFPAVIEEIELGQHERVRMRPDESPDLHSWTSPQQIQRAVGRPVVENDVSVDDRIVMSEKELELSCVVPAGGVQMDSWSRVHCEEFLLVPAAVA